MQDIVDDYTDHVVPLIQKYKDAFQSMSEGGRGLEAFKNAASLVASRAFAVDAEHGDGMVPLADVFNHKVSVVRLNEEYGVNGVDDDDEDGENDDDEENKGETGGEGAFEEGIEPSDIPQRDSIDKNGHPNDEHPCSPIPKRQRTATFPAVQGESPELCGMKEANGLDLRLQIAIIDDEEGDCLQIIAASDVEGGKEVG